MISTLERQWKNGEGQSIPSILDEIKARLEDDTEIKIGTDAQTIGNGVDFVTVVVLYKPRKGGRLYWAHERIKGRMISLWEKLSQEAWLSLETALALEASFPHIKDRMEVHLDANTNPKWGSTQYHKAVAGMIMSQGFSCILKPLAWVSSHAADHLVKNRHITSKARRRYKRELKKAG